MKSERYQSDHIGIEIFFYQVSLALFCPINQTILELKCGFRLVK